MITVDVRGLDSVRSALKGLSAQMPFILSTAINTTAFAVRTAEQKEMRTVFDRPSPWVVNQLLVQTATKQNLTAIVNFKTPKVDALLSPNVMGGLRGRKAYELVLQSMGVLPAGMRIVPALFLRMTKSGDASKATINRIIQGVKTKGSGYFVIKTKGHRLHPGIWFKGKDRKVQPQLLFVPQASYRARYDFGGVGLSTITHTLQPAIESAIQRAIETAR